MSEIHPLISVIIPVYNGEEFLLDALQSIQQQSYEAIEIVVIDDGSTDGSAAIAKAFRPAVRYVYQSHLGLPIARNTGLHTASGDLIAFLDADDLWSENKLTLQFALLSKNPSIDIALGRTQKMRLISEKDGAKRFEPWSEPSVALSLGSALIRNSAFAKVGEFGEDLQYCCDWDWFMRARELEVRMGIHQDTVQYYRRHHSNMTEKIEEGNQATLRMLKSSLMRRRDVNAEIPKSLPQLAQFEISARITKGSTSTSGEH